MAIVIKFGLGYRGLERYTYQTDSNILCLKLVTDGTVSFKGFNATYTKFYNGTDIKGGWHLGFELTYMGSNDRVWWVGWAVGVAIADHGSAEEHLQ